MVVKWVFCHVVSLCILTAIFPGGPGSASTRMSILLGAKDDGDDVDNQSYKTCKAPVRSLPSANQQSAVNSPDAIPVAQAAVSEHWRENVLVMLQNTSLSLSLCFNGLFPGEPGLAGVYW